MDRTHNTLRFVPARRNVGARSFFIPALNIIVRQSKSEEWLSFDHVSLEEDFKKRGEVILIVINGFGTIESITKRATRNEFVSTPAESGDGRANDQTEFMERRRKL